VQWRVLHTLRLVVTLLASLSITLQPVQPLLATGKPNASPAAPEKTNNKPLQQQNPPELNAWNAIREPRPEPSQPPSSVPQRTRLAFERDGVIYITHSDVAENDYGRVARPIAVGTQPAWSSDGKKIAYVNNGGIWVINSDGTNAHAVVTPSTGGFVAVKYTDPAWKPNSNDIAFTWYETDFVRRINVVTDNGSYGVNHQNVVNRVFIQFPGGIITGHDPAFNPTWSPDGQRIAFISYRNTGSMSTQLADIYQYSLSTPAAQHINLTSGNSTVHNINNPAWSPDGTALAFNGGSHVYRAAYSNNSLGFVGQWQDLGEGANPSWSPDNARLAFEHTTPTSTGTPLKSIVARDISSSVEDICFCEMKREPEG
jgi:Tol biopolymer transport system component